MSVEGREGRTPAVPPSEHVSETCGFCGQTFDPGKGALVAGRHPGTGKLMFMCCVLPLAVKSAVGPHAKVIDGNLTTMVEITRPDSKPVSIYVDGRHVTTVEWQK